MVTIDTNSKLIIGSTCTYHNYDLKLDSLTRYHSNVTGKFIWRLFFAN